MELCLQFLSFCTGKNGTGPDDDAEQKKKNIAIEKQISKSKAALRKEQKILLLGTVLILVNYFKSLIWLFVETYG